MVEQQIQKEINKLEKIKRTWPFTRMNKNVVSDLLSEIRSFNHTFTAQYKYAQDFYFHNSSAEIEITDGIEELKNYLKSKLKKKDDRYYYSGIENIKNGLDRIIKGLKDKQERLKIEKHNAT